MEYMKKSAILIVMLCLCFCMSGIAAYGAEVQVDGKILQTENAPINYEGRIYLPLRNVFEAVGAKVTWNGDEQRVTAMKDATVVTFVVGENTAQIKDNSVIKSVVFQGQPFIQSGVTYVPVRFVAEAFGLTVGWDGAAQTAIVIDKEKLLAKYTGPYTHYYKMATFAERMQGAFKLTMRYASPYNIEQHGSLDMIMDAQGNAMMTMNINWDYTSTYLASGYTEAEVLQMDTHHLTEVKFIMDATTGMGYAHIEKVNETIVEDPTWYCVDLSALLPSLSQKEQSTTAKELLELVPSIIGSNSINSYETMRSTLNWLESLLADDGFVLERGNGYINAQEIEISNGTFLKVQLGYLVDEMQNVKRSGMQLGIATEGISGYAQMFQDADSTFDGTIALKDVLEIDFSGDWVPYAGTVSTTLPYGVVIENIQLW